MRNWLDDSSGDQPVILVADSGSVAGLIDDASGKMVGDMDADSELKEVSIRFDGPNSQYMLWVKIGRTADGLCAHTNDLDLFAGCPLTFCAVRTTSKEVEEKARTYPEVQFVDNCVDFVQAIRMFLLKQLAGFRFVQFLLKKERDGSPFPNCWSGNSDDGWDARWSHECIPMTI